jgi:uncharacterized Tic20 family protein
MDAKSAVGPGHVPTGEERTWAILLHVLSIFFWIIPSLVVYLAKRDESPYLAEHAREALNFQITFALMMVGLAVSIIGILFLWLPGIIDVVVCIVAAIRASDNRPYRYPLSLRLIR